MRGPVVILGAGGFIGRHLAETIAASGTAVVAATRRATSFSHPGITNVTAAFDRDTDFLPLLARSSAVIHAASSSTPGSSAAQPQLEGNLRTTLALVEALQETPSCRALFLSSGGTLYGERDTPASESDALRPRSYHGAGKAAAEHFLHAWATQYDGTAIIIRPSNVYGPGQSARRGFAIIPTAFECASSGSPLTIWGDGTSLRDYLYVDDLLSLCEGALSAPMAPGVHTFNAASGEAVSLNSLLDHIDEVTRRPLCRLYREARRVDVHSITADASAARKAFGWHPLTPLDDGLARAWQWFSTRE